MSEQRAALYLRVSTGRQAEHDLSIPDQRRQLEAYCRDKGWRIVAEYVEPGASATDDRRPEFQRMMEAATEKPPAFDVILVHSFSRFFRDHFELEFYVRRLNKHGVKLVSRTQELGDDPTSVLMRQIMALFDEYQSRENAKHVLRSMKENARQGFWNGSRPPLGYRAVAVEQRGVRIKKRLEIDPLQADTIRLMFRLALTGENGSGPMGVKAIATYLNERGIRTRDGGRFGLAHVYQILTRTTYAGRHRFNTRDHKTKQPKPETEVVEMAVPAIVDPMEFAAVQERLRARNPKVVPPRVVSGPILLTGICFCADCGGAMMLRTGKSGRYRYYTCGTAARVGKTGCRGRSVPMAHLDRVVVDQIERRLLEPGRLAEILRELLERRHELANLRHARIAELRRKAGEADARLSRLYQAIEEGVADLGDANLKARVAELRAARDEAQRRLDLATRDADGGEPQEITLDRLHKFAVAARRKLRTDNEAYGRDYVRAFAQHVVVGERSATIMGSPAHLLDALSSVESAAFGVPSFVQEWRARRDSNPRPHA